MDEYKLWQLYHLNSQIRPGLIISKKNKKSIKHQKSTIFKNFPSWNLHQNDMCSPEFAFISELLKSSYSLREEALNRRTAPSAGALYPIDIYFSLNSNSEQMLNGIYYYSVEESHIYLIKEHFNHQTTPNLFIQNELYNARMIIYFVAHFVEMESRYGERGYRFALLETGHIAQNFNLNAIRLNASFKNIGGYYERAINTFLCLDGLDASCIYCMAIF